MNVSREALSGAPYVLDPERSRKILALIFQRLSSAGQARVAEAVGVSESTISKMKAGDLELVSRILSYCGLKVVPVEMRCFNPEKIGAILTLAKDNLANISGPEALTWEDPE